MVQALVRFRSEQRIYTSITIQELAHLLRSEGYWAEAAPDWDGPPTLKLKVHGLHCCVYLCGGEEGRATSLLFHSAFDARRSLEQVNAFNSQKRFAKLYLDEDGDANVDLDVDLDGGVTHEYLQEILQRWTSVLRLFVEFLRETED